MTPEEKRKAYYKAYRQKNKAKKKAHNKAYYQKAKTNRGVRLR